MPVWLDIVILVYRLHMILICSEHARYYRGPAASPWPSLFLSSVLLAAPGFSAVPRMPSTPSEFPLLLAAPLDWSQRLPLKNASIALFPNIPPSIKDHCRLFLPVSLLKI
uniref:Uncharacterized protein n=1 Tax=Arundo donax TaxID=35708 RepID=A0A0A9F1F1_ARUDO